MSRMSGSALLRSCAAAALLGAAALPLTMPSTAHAGWRGGWGGGWHGGWGAGWHGGWRGGWRGGWGWRGPGCCWGGWGYGVVAPPVIYAPPPVVYAPPFYRPY